MSDYFAQLNVDVLLYTDSDFTGLPLRESDIAEIKLNGLPKTCPPNSLRFKVPASMGGTGFSRLSDEWPKFKESPAAQACIVIATDSNGNCLFINTTEQGNHQVSFYDHDYGVVRFVSAGLSQFLSCLKLYLGFLKQYPENGQTPATQEDYQALADRLVEIEPLARVNTDTFWQEMVFLGKLR